MNPEQFNDAEKEASSQALEEFVRVRQSSGEVTTYEELQLALRDKIDVPSVVADYVKSHGEPKTIEQSNESFYYKCRSGKYLITAISESVNADRETVTITSRRRKLQLLSLKSTKLVTMNTNDPTWDHAVLYRPTRDSFLPSNSSPEAIDFWASKGEWAIYGDDSGRPTSTTGQVARRAAAEAHDVFNGYLDTVVWLVDKLVNAEKT
jgi:hypothetical protein